jgi:hypothetical protein
MGPIISRKSSLCFQVLKIIKYRLALKLLERMQGITNYFIKRYCMEITPGPSQDQLIIAATRSLELYKKPITDDKLKKTLSHILNDQNLTVLFKHDNLIYDSSINYSF